MRRQATWFLAILFLVLCFSLPSGAQAPASEQVQVSAPVRRIEPPPANATAAELEARADALRAEKAYLDSLDYFRAPLAKKPNTPQLYHHARALQLDPDIFEHTSRIGVTAQLPSPEDRARYDYVVARLYAKMGLTERSLQYLRKALEEGYKDINQVYKDAEFTELRKDPRFTELMAARPPAIPE